MHSIENGIERISYKQSPTQVELHTIFVNIRAQGTHCVIVGEGIMGAKAENLLKYAEEICAAGFFMKPMVILTDECFAEMLSLDTHVMENPDKSEHILSVDKKLRMFLEEIHTYFASENVLFVRSSAVGDSAGTGVRESHRGKNTITLLEENIKRVLASDMTDQVKQFRKDAGIDEGLATIIMPIVGNNYHNIFAPCISGYAFTNQFQKGIHLTMGPGIGGGVHTQYALCLSESEIRQHDTIENFTNELFVQGHDTGTMRHSPELYAFSEHADMYVSRNHEQQMGSFLSFDYEEESRRERDLYDQACQESLLPMVEQLTALKQRIGSELYVEFSLQKDGKQAHRYINQLHLVSPSSHHIELIPEEKTLAYANSILNSGKKTIDTRVTVPYAGGMETLHTFNKTHSDYGIIIYDRALSSINPPTYVSYSNASVILMIVSRNCARPPLSHFGGQVQMSSKLFGAIMQPAPRIGYEPQRVPHLKELRHNSGLENAMEKLPGASEILSNGDFTDIYIKHTSLIFEADESKDYGVLYKSE